MPEFGPLIPVRARQAGAVLLLGSLEFIGAMIAVQLAYPGYSDFGNYISDLGGKHSPWALTFDGSAIVLGLLALLATVLLLTAFNKRLTRTLGLGFFGIAGIGAVMVGVFPETTPVLNGNMHEIASDIAFLGSGLALLFLPGAMLRDTRWEGYRAFTFLMGIVTLVAIVLFSTSVWGALGPGGMERIIVAPILLWAIVVGIHLRSLPTYERVPIAHST
ncbi:MAG: DUF998 domain-containing protein [Thermoplasmata archaeon]|nr:DUF998 domain-containing protein [Thermoplasmata archaeon]